MPESDPNDSPLQCVGCCVFPHGRRGTIWIIVLCVLSYIFLCTATFGCDFMRIDGYLSSQPPYVYENSLEDHGYGVGGENFMCIRYRKPQIEAYFDGTFKLARGFAVMANVAVFLASLVVLMSTCATLNRFILKAAGYLLIIGSGFTLLMFVFFASDSISDDPHHRRIGWGSGFNITSMILSAIAGVLTARPAPDSPEPCSSDGNKVESQSAAVAEQPKKVKKKRAMPPGAEVVEQTILPDGSSKYTTTKWNQDGTCTKTEEIVQAP